MLQPENYAIHSRTPDGCLKDGTLDEAFEDARQTQSPIIRCVDGHPLLIFPGGGVDEINWDEVRRFNFEE